MQPTAPSGLSLTYGEWHPIISLCILHRSASGWQSHSIMDMLSSITSIALAQAIRHS